MIIDLHVHTMRYSPCSRIQIGHALAAAKQRGLDGICFTDHETFGWRSSAAELSKQYGILILTGIEILAEEGDLLCYGISTVPGGVLPAQDLIDYVTARGGAAVAAHPFRENGRSVMDSLNRLQRLSAVEAYNGNTPDKLNKKAAGTAADRGLPTTGGSDAHRTDRIGVFATHFDVPVRNEEELAAALRAGNISPVSYNYDTGMYIPL